MKKFTALITAMMIPLCTVSCSGKTGENSGSAVTSENEAALMSFRSADIRMAEDFDRILCTDKRGAQFLIFGQLKTGELAGYVTDSQFTERTLLSLDPQVCGEVRTAALMPYGKAAVLGTIEDETIITVYDNSGGLEKTLELGEVITENDRFIEMVCGEDGFYINIDRQTLVFADSDGHFKGEVSTGRRTLCGVTIDSSGSPCVLMSEGMETTLGTLSQGTVTGETSCGELADHVNGICTGMGGDRIAVVAVGGMYALREDGWVRLTDFSDNDFKLHEVIDMDMIGEGEYTVLLLREKGNYELRLLSQRDISEIRQKQVVKLASLSASGGMDPYDDLIKKFNSENDTYKIEIVSYISQNIDDAASELKMDIVSGKAPDIVVLDMVPAESFGSPENVFADMYDLLDKDETLSREDFVDGFLDRLAVNDHLVQISGTFGVSTTMVKDKHTGGLSSWSFDQFEEIYRNKPADMDFSYTAPYTSMTDMFCEVAEISSFYDLTKAECRFDSPEFVRIMKFVKENHIGVPESQVTGYGGESVQIPAFRNDKVLLQNTYLMGFSSIQMFTQVYSGEPVTFIGRPGGSIRASAQPGRRYGIMANSANIDGAWDFLKYYLFSEDSTSAPGNSWNFSCIEERYKEQLEYLCTPHTYTDPETGEEKNADYFGYVPDGQIEAVNIELHPFTADEAAKYDELVRSALSQPIRGDGKVLNIVLEEAAAYFEGERSAEDAARIIQDRASTYLSEQY